MDLKQPKESSYFQQVTYVDDRLGHDLRYAIDATYISKTMGFEPSYTLSEGITETIEWYLQNKNWVKNKVND